MAASDGTANPAAIAQLVSEGPAAVKDLLLDELQIAFDREATGELQMAREGGHHGCRTVRPSHASAMSR
jgi:L-aspartate oxidase